jgi:hypothetical protein
MFILEQLFSDITWLPQNLKRFHRKFSFNYYRYFIISCLMSAFQLCFYNYLLSVDINCFFLLAQVEFLMTITIHIITLLSANISVFFWLYDVSNESSNTKINELNIYPCIHVFLWVSIHKTSISTMKVLSQLCIVGLLFYFAT